MSEKAENAEMEIINVKLAIKEKSQADNPLSIAELFEVDIPDDWVCLSVKINNVAQQAWDEEDWIPETVAEFIYIELLQEKEYFQSVGYHKNGANKKPHIHINLIYPPTKYPENFWRTKDKFCKKNEYDKDDFKDISFKYLGTIDNTKAKYMFLSYPLKEGHASKGKFQYMYNGRRMTTPEKQFLIDIGTSIHETELAHNLANDKYEEKKQNEFLEMLRFAKEKSEMIQSYHDLCLLMDEFVDAKPFNKKPCPRTYKSNIQKIGNCLGIFKYSSML